MCCERGQYDQPDQKRPVSRRPPLVLGQLAKTSPQNRLGLAQWLVSPRIRLLARVTVNRLWHQIFGTGLVKTVEDFGVQGEFPSHPELLDYLACEFRDGRPAEQSGAWSTKHLVRLIVTSATYRQASTVRADLAEQGSRQSAAGAFPRQRLTAEEIRDQALFAAGLLSTRLGGPPVFPYQPAGLWEERGNEASNTKVYKRERWRVAVSPQPLYILEANLPAAVDERLRRAGSRGLRGPPLVDEHTVASPGDLE